MSAQDQATADLAVRATGVGKVFATATGDVVALTDVELTVEAGEFVSLIGPSGCGKSTLLRLIADLDDASSGQLSIFGKTARQARIDQDYGIAFQQAGLLPWRTVAGNIELPLELHKVGRDARAARVAELAQLVGLSDFMDRYPDQLSGGMQQRVGLARAFATEAPILLMDEPFSALDPLIRTKLQDELLQLQKSLKKTIVFVSHDLEEALKIGNRITIMEGGRIVQSGTPEDIVLKPANAYVRDFIANVNPLSVLTAWNVMRSKHELESAGRGWIWLDRRKTTRFKLDKDGFVIAAERDGKPAVWVSCDEIESLPDDAPHVFWARPGTSLKTVMLAIHRSQASPVGLFDDASRFVGAIGVRDVLSAVLRR